MIETKIACQCGNRFKFGLEPVNGRAPDGLRCPTCNAPVTPACNTLLDYLSGKNLSPEPAATRVVKEIRVVCTCSARYKFDLELAEEDMPAGATCPQCQTDLTALANEQLRNYRTKYAAELSAAPAPAPAPASAAVPAPAAAPAASVPASAPAPVEPAAPAASQPAAAPAAPVPPAAPAPPPAKKPAEPPAPAPSGISDPFGPPAETKSNIPNLPTLDPSKFQPSGPPPKRPAPGAAKPPGSSAPKPGSKPEAGKPAGQPGAAKPAGKTPAQPAKSPAKASEPNLVLGIVGALVGALVGAGLWFAVTKATGSVGTYLAVVVGALAGLGGRLLGRAGSPPLAGAACCFAVLVMIIMVRTGFYAAQDIKNTKDATARYPGELEKAKPAKDLKTDDEIKAFMKQQNLGDDMGSGAISDKALEFFKTKTLPDFLALAEGTPASREAHITKQVKRSRRSFDLENDWDDTIGIVGLLSLVAGLLAAGFITKP